MSWLWWSIGALAALTALVVIVGYLLPRHHVASRSARFAARPETVWALIADPASGPSWRSGLSAVRAATPVDGRERWIEVDRHGEILFELMESTPPLRRVVRIADDTLPFGGRWIYQLAPDGDGARLTITEEGEVRNPVFRFVSALIIGHAATIDTYLRDVGRGLAKR
jgi:hypothetical protein